MFVILRQQTPSSPSCLKRDQEMFWLWWLVQLRCVLSCVGALLLWPHPHRTRNETQNKWDLLMWMGVSTLHASNIKGFAFDFARPVWIGPERLCQSFSWGSGIRRPWSNLQFLLTSACSHISCFSQTSAMASSGSNAPRTVVQHVATTINGSLPCRRDENWKDTSLRRPFNSIVCAYVRNTAWPEKWLFALVVPGRLDSSCPSYPPSPQTRCPVQSLLLQCPF